MAKRFSESQIYRVLLENERGAKIHSLVEKYGISQATFYNWRSKYGAKNKSDMERLSKLEEENKRLKALLVELEYLMLKISLDNMSVGA